MFDELKNARQFCDVLHEQADAALFDNLISPHEHRQIRWFSRLRPRMTWEVMGFVQEQANLAGHVLASNVEEIDWGRLAEFIKQIMPLILAFIQALIFML